MAQLKGELSHQGPAKRNCQQRAKLGRNSLHFEINEAQFQVTASPSEK